MKIELKKSVVSALIEKKAKQGVSPTWFVNDLLERVLINQAPYADTEENINTFLCSFNFFSEYGVGKHKISELYNSFVMGPYNECHFLTQSEFINAIDSYVSSKGYEFILNKPQTSFSLILAQDDKELEQELNKNILFYLDNYIELGVPIMNSELLEKVKEAFPDEDISYQKLSKHKKEWAKQKGYKVVKGKYNGGRWTKFRKLSFEQQLIEDTKTPRTERKVDWVEAVRDNVETEKKYED